LDRSGASVFLIPLLAVMALFYPVAFRKGASEPGASFRTPSGGAQSQATVAQKANNEWSRGRRSVRSFFDIPLDPSQTSRWHSPNNPLDRATLNFLIMTVPDPIDSGLPHMFDRYVGALRQALQTQPYFLSRFDLPWQDCFQGSSELDDGSKGNTEPAIDADQKKKDCDTHRYRKEPGFLLLTNPEATYKSEEATADKNKEPRDKSRTDILLVYLVGETPSGGINKRALNAALTEIAWFCGWSDGHSDDPIRKIANQSRTCKPSTASKGEIEEFGDPVPEGVMILGPSFSGSAQSLDLALSYWLDSIHTGHPRSRIPINIISGTATAIHNPNDPNNGAFFLLSSRLKGDFRFRSMAIPDKVSSRIFCEYLEEMGKYTKDQPFRIAQLVENGTVYGNQAAQAQQEEKNTEDSQAAKSGTGDDPPSSTGGATASSNDDQCEKATTLLPYPLHISQLRAASEKLRQVQEETNPQPQVSSKKVLPLADSLTDAGLRRDILPFSRADSVTAEQVMAGLLDRVSREHYEYVGILATDIRDTMFLAQEVREHSPGSVLFTYNTELLYLHPEINSTLTGMLMVGTYPLAGSNQFWSPDLYAGNLMQFPDENSEGVYNAALVFLDQREHLREYRFPFRGVDAKAKPETFLPPVWITVVGHDRLLPVNAYAVSTSDTEHYTYRLLSSKLKPKEETGDREKIEQEEKIRKSWWSGLFLPHAIVLVMVYAAFCIAFCVWVLRTPREPRRGAASNSDDVGNVLTRYRRESRVYFVPALASLAAFQIPLTTSLVLPVVVVGKYVEKPGLRQPLYDHAGLMAAIVLSCLSLVMLLIATAAIIWATLRKSGGLKPNTKPAIPVLGSVLMLAVSCVVALAWTLMARDGNHTLRIFLACLRYLDLLSGVSPLLPLFLISTAGFVWAIVSYNRRRMFEPATCSDFTQSQSLVLHSTSVLSTLQGLRLRGLTDIEQEIRRRINCSAFMLPGWWIVISLIIVGSAYIFVAFVRELENPAVYWLLGVSFVLVSAVLWFGVLRFYSTWGEVQSLLRYVASTPLRHACKGFRAAYPTPLKLDLAAPVPTLAALSHAVEQVFDLQECASNLLASQSSFQLAGTGSGGRTSKQVSGQSPSLPFTGLVQLSSDSLLQKGKWAEVLLQHALKSLAHNDAQATTGYQCAAQVPLAAAAGTVSSVLDDWWTQSVCPKSESAKSGASDASRLCDLAESFLVGRLVHFIGYVLPQLQQMIAASLAGVLLLLLAVNSYPFPPHDVLVWLNWIVILVLVSIALGVFIQINRDPILSYLNGTTPGKIDWDREFVFRIVIYGVIPILALLGAQFPDSIRQVISVFAPGEGMHH